MLHDAVIDCPYCGERFGTSVDATPALDGELEIDYVEDCAVCCRPIRLIAQLAPDASLVELAPRRDEDV